MLTIAERSLLMNTGDAQVRVAGGAMKHVRFGLLIALVLIPIGLDAQQAAQPNLSREQRSTLQAVVAAVDRDSTTAADSAGVDWPVHVLRASDGSHYVAFSLSGVSGLTPGQPVVLYVRLATRTNPQATNAVVERSAVAEWLAGQRTVPPRPERGIAFGEMPTYGAAGLGARTQTNVSQNLALLEMERERARERSEARERERKAALEGEAVRSARPVLPFEDFDVDAVVETDSSGTAVIRRSITTGPGEYVLTVAWHDGSTKDATRAVRVFRKTIGLPIASTSEFGLSSVIVADSVTVRTLALTPEQQARHPYAIGTTDITPARDAILTNDEPLALVVQVINPRAGANGKPDVAVGFRMSRLTGAGQEHVGVLAPQIYNQTTLPSDFDVLKGHPIFVAVEVPMSTFKRGRYRIQIMAEDRIAGVNATTDTTFSVVGSPAALLRDAPPLALPFRRDALLAPTMLDAIVTSVRPAQPSPALAAALSAASDRRFVDLLRNEPVAPNEEAARATLRSLALYALGDTTTAVALPLRQAAHGSTTAGVHVLIGAAHAIDGRDRDASAAWDAALSAGLDRGLLTPLMVDAALRQGDIERALTLGASAMGSRPTDAVLTRRVAAAHLAAKRASAALDLLNPLLDREPDDSEAQWLRLHARFMEMVAGEISNATPPARESFKQLAARYIESKGRHAVLAAEWAAVIP
jgi:hypothetical protein